jgi:hypothetical protein
MTIREKIPQETPQGTPLKDWEKKLVYRVYYIYADGKSGEAFFTEKSAAAQFAELMKSANNGLLVSVNKWRWNMTIEP